MTKFRNVEKKIKCNIYILQLKWLLWNKQNRSEIKVKFCLYTTRKDELLTELSRIRIDKSTKET